MNKRDTRVRLSEEQRDSKREGNQNDNGFRFTTGIGKGGKSLIVGKHEGRGKCKKRTLS